MFVNNRPLLVRGVKLEACDGADASSSPQRRHFIAPSVVSNFRRRCPQALQLVGLAAAKLCFMQTQVLGIIIVIVGVEIEIAVETELGCRLRE